MLWHAGLTQHLLGLVPQGKVTGNGVLDFSGMHLAVLSVEGVIASVGESNTTLGIEVHHVEHCHFL